MNEDWFAPKRFGYGAGLPIAWQGWAVMVGYLVVAIGSATWLVPRHPVVGIAVIGVATAVLFPVTRRHTRGGWHWRWDGTRP